jgi:hypothetical protein
VLPDDRKLADARGQRGGQAEPARLAHRQARPLAGVGQHRRHRGADVAFDIKENQPEPVRLLGWI